MIQRRVCEDCGKEFQPERVWAFKCPDCASLEEQYTANMYSARCQQCGWPFVRTMSDCEEGVTTCGDCTREHEEEMRRARRGLARIERRPGFNCVRCGKPANRSCENQASLRIQVHRDGDGMVRETGWFGFCGSCALRLLDSLSISVEDKNR